MNTSGGGLKAARGGAGLNMNRWGPPAALLQVPASQCGSNCSSDPQWVRISIKNNAKQTKNPTMHYD